MGPFHRLLVSVMTLSAVACNVGAGGIGNGDALDGDAAVSTKASTSSS